MVGRHQNFDVPKVESPTHFRAATDERFAEGNIVVGSIAPMPVHFPPNGPLGLGAGQVSRAVLSLQSLRALPSPSFFICAFRQGQLDASQL